MKVLTILQVLICLKKTFLACIFTLENFQTKAQEKETSQTKIGFSCSSIISPLHIARVPDPLNIASKEFLQGKYYLNEDISTLSKGH